MKKMKLMVVGFVALILTSCSTLNHSMKEPNINLTLTKSDFTLSEQVSAEATTVKVLGIDWSRLFSNKTGTLEGGSNTSITASIPVIGNLMTDKTSNYSLYELMMKNPNYDVVIYPQYETTTLKPVLGLGFITKITKVKATARLGKLK